MSSLTRPALRYMGGKWRMGPWVAQHFPAHEAYVEPYGGAASVLLQKARAQFEVYNDLDGDVVNLFQILRDRGPELTEQIRLTPYARTEFRISHEPIDDPMERARRLMIRSFMSVGGMRTYVKTNGKISHSGFENSTRGNRNNPASVSWGNLPASMPALVERLRGVIIESMPALNLIRAHDRPGALFYLDPPYAIESRADPRRSRYRLEMTEADHEELAATLQAVAGMVVISGYRCPLYDRLYAGWRRRDFKAMAFGQRPRTESIWMRNIDLDLFNTDAA